MTAERTPATGRAPSGARRLRAVETRLAALEGEVASVVAGGPIPPAPASRSARLSRALIAGGLVLIAVAILLAAV